MKARSTVVQLVELIRRPRKLEFSRAVRKQWEVWKYFRIYADSRSSSEIRAFRTIVPDGSRPGPVPPLQTSFVFRAYLRNGSAHSVFRRRHGPAVANESRNTEVPRTWEFHVCRWNLISAAFVMEHDRAFSTLLPAARASFPFFQPWYSRATSNRYLGNVSPDEFW